MSSSKNIRLMRSSVIYGPFSADQLRHMASTQKIKSTDLVSVDNGPWKPIKLSVNAETQKNMRKPENPPKTAEAPADPKPEAKFAKNTPLYNRIVDSVIDIRSNPSKNSANSTVSTQTDSGDESLTLPDISKPILDKILKNKLLSAIGFGTILLPCLLCGFFGMVFQNSSQSPVIPETPQSNESSLAIARNLAKNKLIEILGQLEDKTDAMIVRSTIRHTEANLISISRADELTYPPNLSLTPETIAAYRTWRSALIKAPLSSEERIQLSEDIKKTIEENEKKQR